MYFRSERFLLFYDCFRDMVSEKLDIRPGVTNNIFHHLVKRIAKARHMYSRLSSSKVGVQIKSRIEPLVLSSLTTEENSFCNSNYSYPSKTYVHAWFAILNVSI